MVYVCISIYINTHREIHNTYTHNTHNWSDLI